jgi:cytochrome c
MRILGLLLIVSMTFSSCGKSLSKKEKEAYLEKGKEITMATQKHLGGNLVKKMKEGGVKEAVPFCNTKAMPLTQEMSETFNVRVKRTSHRLRNDKNAPDEAEKLILTTYNKSLAEHKAITPVVKLGDDGKVHYYAPIIVQKKCLVCHGEIGTDVTVKSDSIIKSFYPNDLATGFKEGDLRGIWSITFLN